MRGQAKRNIQGSAMDPDGNPAPWKFERVRGIGVLGEISGTGTARPPGSRRGRSTRPLGLTPGGERVP